MHINFKSYGIPFTLISKYANNLITLSFVASGMIYEGVLLST